MSYAMSGALQAAVFNALATDAALTALVGTDIYDAVPTGAVPETYVSLGRERVQDASDKLVSGVLSGVIKNVLIFLVLDSICCPSNFLVFFSPD